MMSCEDRLIRGTVDVARATTPAARKRLRNGVHSGSTYVRHALLHPAPHLLALAAAMFLGALFASLVVAAVIFIAAELFLLTHVPRLRAFREYVDAKLDAAKRLAAAEARSALLAKLSGSHRRELERLELLIDRIRDRLRSKGSGAQLVVDDYLGLDRLIATYVRLAIVHRSSSECLAATDRANLEDEIRSLEASSLSALPPARELAQQRLMIATKRAERWDRSHRDLDAIGQQLAMIADLVRLTHEQFAAPIDPQATSEELDRAIEALEESHATLRELAECLVAEDTVEPGLLELGRVQTSVGLESVNIVPSGSTSMSPVRIAPEGVAPCECQECRARRLVASLVPDSWGSPPARSA